MADTSLVTDSEIQATPESPEHSREHLGSFEAKCVNLLCKQEHKVAQLGQSDCDLGTIEALDLTKQMLLEFLDFAESHFSDEELTHVSTALHDVYRRTKEHEKNLNARSWKMVRRLVGASTPSDEELCQRYRELLGDYTQLYARFLGICATRFTDGTQEKAEFLQSVDLFLDEMKQKW